MQQLVNAISNKYVIIIQKFNCKTNNLIQQQNKCDSLSKLVARITQNCSKSQEPSHFQPIPSRKFSFEPAHTSRV